MEFIEAKNPEWLDMWSELSAHPLNNGDPICLFKERAWEYMGSTQDHHHLRHRLHPKTQTEEFVYIERRRSCLPQAWRWIA